MSGHIWSYTHCPHTELAAKVDSNVHLDLELMFDYLRANIARDWENMIACPTMSPEPYNKVIRATAAPMTGRWAESEEDWARDTLPDFCVGWLTIITPRPVLSTQCWGSN